MRFEIFLGKYLSFAEELIGTNFKSKDYGKKFYINDENLNRDLYGMTYSFITIITDEKNIVESITVHFREVINRPFYDSLIQKYGEPGSTLVIEKSKVVSESTIENDDFTQNLVKRDIELREGTFEENPLFVIWGKDGFQIKAFLRHKQNISEVTFSIVTD